MSLHLTVLGSNAAKPTHGRFTSSQVLKQNDRLYLIDCGEGCQIRLSQYKIKRNRIEAIFISHLHGDHLFGLPGVLTSFFHFNRSSKLQIIGPVGLREYIETTMRLSQSHLNSPVEIKEVIATSLTPVFETTQLEVFAFPLKHRIETNGYIFKEKMPVANIMKEKIEELNLSIEEIKLLKTSTDVTRPDGTIIHHQDVLTQKYSPKSYAYCSDTVYDESIVPYIKEVDLLYHETTYLDELRDKAEERKHSTAKEAALIAKLADVKALMIGHYSGKYRDVEPLRLEAEHYFSTVYAAYDGFMIEV